MLLRTLLHDRYAILKNLSERSVEVYAITLLWFDRFLVTRTDRAPGAGSLDDLDDLVVAGFLRWRATQVVRGRRVSPATVTIDFPSLPQSKTIHRIPVAYTVEEIRRMIGIARTRTGFTGPVPSGWWWSTLLGVAFVTGERIGALRQLRWGQVDLVRRRIMFLAETRKGGRQDVVRSISPALARELAAHAGEPDALVWPWPRAPLSIYASLKKVCLRADVTPRGFHAIRKSSASYVAAGGGNASAHLGHSDPTIAKDHYLDPRIMVEEAGIDFLPDLEEGVEPPFSP